MKYTLYSHAPSPINKNQTMVWKSPLRALLQQKLREWIAEFKDKEDEVWATSGLSFFLSLLSFILQKPRTNIKDNMKQQ